MDGSRLGFPGYLHNYWVKQLTTAQDCAILGLSRSAEKDFTLFQVKPDWEDCTILDPSKLPDKIVQFLEGRLVSLQNCAIYWGGLIIGLFGHITPDIQINNIRAYQTLIQLLHAQTCQLIKYFLL